MQSGSPGSILFGLAYFIFQRFWYRYEISYRVHARSSVEESK
jgi:hypothetical protein